MERPKVPTARELMTRKLITLRPEMPIVEAAALLLKHRISGAPVVGPKGELLGLLSEFDCLQVVASADYEMDSHDAIETVRELMTTVIHSVSPDADLFAVAHRFVTQRVRRLPVLEGDRLLGQVSRRDALAAVVRMRREMDRARHHYPDYPEGRDPIRNYPH